MSAPTTLPPHPLADLLPPMSQEDYEELRDSIRANGQREPITLHRDGRVLDGKHRDRACIELGIPTASKTFDGPDTDLLELVLDLNLKRRHLNESQRAIIATKVATFGRGRPSNNAAQAAFTQAAAAKKFSVSPDSLQRARVVLEHAEPEIVTAVEDGTLTVKVAAAIAKQPRERQLGRLARDLRKAAGTYRHEEDYYRTPPECVRALLAKESFSHTILEPACGDGPISRELEAFGHTVISTDLIDRGFGEGGVDFLAEQALRADDLITNPPYELADDFAVHALELGVRKMALLCRLVWLEGQDRYSRLYSQHKLARVWIFSARQTLWRGDDEAAEDDGGQTAYAWFVFEREHNGPVTCGWLTTADGGSS
jgi:ParB-like chromosome segregation protein Spo0J